MRLNIKAQGPLLFLALMSLHFLAPYPGCDLKLPLLGSPCAYLEVPGTATIVAIREAAPGKYNCPEHPMEVVFSFKAQDPNFKATSPGDGVPLLLQVGSGMNPPLLWVQEQGLAVGAVRPCVRRELARGACVPVRYDFPDLDFPAADKLCFPE